MVWALNREKSLEYSYLTHGIFLNILIRLFMKICTLSLITWNIPFETWNL